MGITDRPVLDLIHKVRSWIRGALSGGSLMSVSPDLSICFECQGVATAGQGHRCQSCGRLFCRNCMQMDETTLPKFCRFCYQAIGSREEAKGGSVERFDSGLFPSSLHFSNCRIYDEDDGDERGRHYLSPMSEVSPDYSDIDANSVCTSHEFYSFKSSPLDSPGRAGDQGDNSPILDQVSQSYCRENTEHSVGSYDNLVVRHDYETQKAQLPLDFENSRIWYPPRPEDEEGVETGFFPYDEDDDYVSDSSEAFSSAVFSEDGFTVKEKPNDANKEHLMSSFHGHFRALVADLLKVHVGSENGGEGWLEIVSSLAWQAATYVKPDTSKGCSNDPGDYVKVKCISSGSRSDSMLIKGVVCTKNIKHKHMVSQHRNPRLLILGGALEYQKVSNKLASISTVLEEEREHLKMVVSKIEAHRPNVLLVEKGVSSYAQQYLAKEISLVLNVKRTLLERISQCTGAQIAPSIDNLGSVRLGQCEMFQIVKVPEECSSPSYPSKKSSKTLMFFVGCPRRLGCTVLLKGARLEVLKMVKHVIRLASFAAYHLSRETSFLADEGASLPKIPLKFPMVISGRAASANTYFLQSTSPAMPNMLEANAYEHHKLDKALEINSEQEEDGYCNFRSTQNVSLGGYGCSTSGFKCKEPGDPSQCQADARTEKGEFVENSLANTCHLRVANEEKVNVMDDRNSIPHQSILVSFSSSCILKGSVCEPSRLFRIKFYGTSDKPLGRYLRDDLFDPSSCCRSCKEPAESHVRSYIHQQGSLTISVKRLPSIMLPGERDGRIWMWHRCLKCERNDGVPPAAHRVAMSNAAWGLSFGKFLELSFSNHATANRIASCGHSLQRDCLRFYGFGSMVAFFRYSSVDILSVQLPSLKLDFVWDIQQEWVRREAASISDKVEFLHDEVSNVLYDLERSVTASKHESLKTSIHDHISDLRDLLKRERREYDVLLDSATTESTQPSQTPADILELNRLRRCLLIDSFTWDRRLDLLDSVSKGKISSTSMVDPQLSDTLTHSKLREFSDETFCKESGSVGTSTDSLLPKHHRVTTGMQVLECNTNNLVEMDLSIESVEGYVGPAGFNLLSGQGCRWDEKPIGAELEGTTVSENNLSDNIDLLWTGSGQPPSSSPSNAEADSVESPTPMGNSRYRKLISPIRVYSFDSALRYRNKASGSSSPHFSSLKSLRLSGDFVKDPIQNLRQAYTQRSLRATRSLNFLSNQMPSRATSEGARFLLPQPGLDKIVILVYDNDPTSIISYAISSLEHANFIAGNSDHYEGSSESISCFHDDLQSQCYGPDEPQQLLGNLYTDPKESHFRISFEDDSSSHTDKVKFSVTCYCARQFDALRKRFCPNEVDFIRSLSRCKTWKAQGGKSNVYFAKSLDERFIIKQVTKTELDSFEEFAPEYFKYFTESISSGSPTCLAKVLGIYQVNIKHLKGGREVKMDLMVMENLFFQRNISKVYDLKGSSRARYNPDTSGNKVLLDSNLLMTLRTKPIYLGITEKRKLEQAVWNDTSFLANIDVMDYSLLVGVDEEKKELVIGIIDFMRQYTWDKHLETWVKASGILGGPKNEPPTVVSPDQYKKRFRKAMTGYFQPLPEKWTS